MRDAPITMAIFFITPLLIAVPMSLALLVYVFLAMTRLKEKLESKEDSVTNGAFRLQMISYMAVFLFIWLPSLVLRILELNQLSIPNFVIFYNMVCLSMVGLANALVWL